MKHKTSYLALPLILLAFYFMEGCEKMDKESNLIEIFAEPLNEGAKVSVDGADATWVDGDKICLNGTTLSVERHDGHSYIPCETPLSVNRAVYPASLATNALGSDVVTLKFPAYYHFHTDGSGKQLLELPMAARSTDNNPLEFKHLTGALCFVVHNNGSVPLTLQMLTVGSTKYQLSGSRSVDFSNIEGVGAMETATAADRQVRMLFDAGYVLPAGESLNVMMPIAPVGSDHRFSVELRYQTEDETSFLFRKFQENNGVDHTLLRNQLGYAGVDLTNAIGGKIYSTTLLEIISDVCYIYTQRDFLLWHNAVNRKDAYLGNKCYYWNVPCNIMEDIDMTGISLTPIMEYSSTLYGNNHTISNLTLESCVEPITLPSHVCGLFYNHKNYSISNLILDNLTLKHTVNATRDLFIGALFAKADEGADVSISGCTVNIGSVIITGTVANGTIYCGGLLGQLGKVATFTNCHVTTPSITISGEQGVYWGGLVGKQDVVKALTINNSSWQGTVNLSSGLHQWAGGLVGGKSGGNLTISSCQVQGVINATVGGTPYLASLIGQYSNQGTISISGTTPAVSITVNGSNMVSVPQYN